MTSLDGKVLKGQLERERGGRMTIKDNTGNRGMLESEIRVCHKYEYIEIVDQETFI